MVSTRIWTYGLSALALAALATWAQAATGTYRPPTPAPAQPTHQPSTTDKKPATPVKHTSLPGEWAGMVRECQMTPDQVEQAWQRIDAKKKAVADFDKQKPTKLAQLHTNLTDAKKKNDDASAAKVQEAIKALEGPAEKEKLEMTQDLQILGTLKPDQRILWEGLLLYQKAVIELKGDNLKAEQLPAVREICNGLAKDVIASPDLYKARKDVVSKVVNAFHKEGPMPGEKK